MCVSCLTYNCTILILHQGKQMLLGMSQIHQFIDPTWAPGITSGLLEEDVHIEGTGSEESENLEAGSAIVSKDSKMQIGNQLTLFLDGTHKSNSNANTAINLLTTCICACT